MDTRGPSGPYGAPSLSAGVQRNFALLAGPCTGLPAGVKAYSLNITVTNTAGPGFIKIFPQGGATPVVSTLNYVGGQTIANAAIVPAGTAGGVTVAAGVSGTDLIIDINGYYGETPGNQNDYFQLLNNSTGYTMYLQNSSSSCSGPCGLRAGVNSGIAIEGDAFGQSGKTYGVLGQTFSTSSDAAGVRGIDASGPTAVSGFVTAGVRGESRNSIGVAGISQSTSYGGVDGAMVDSNGTIIQEGRLGSSSYGVYSFGDIGAGGTKFFVEPHPTDASKVIRYISLEGREPGTYFRGSARFVNGRAVINVPEDFRMVSDVEGLTVQLTPVGAPASTYVVSEDLNQIVVGSDRDVKFHYMVNGVRKAVEDYQPISEGSEFMPRSPTEKMPAYLTEEAKRRLIANGTYNADGTVNMATAERLGWTRIWADRGRAADRPDSGAGNGQSPR